MHHGTNAPTGCVIANDVDFKRAQMLVHQSKRLNSPCVIVTSHDAQTFPALKIPKTESTEQEILHFDRILCDVPCSGDGTLRKNKQIWKSFTPHTGNGLFPLQLSILQRALKLLSTDGRIVYSTCSFNPIENEAVVAQMIRASEGKLRIVDCSLLLPKMKRAPGLKTWIVAKRNGQEIKEPENKIVDSMFPPTAEEELGLEKCMRFYPHYMNTGGFFVAIIERIPDTNEGPKRQAEDTLESTDDKKQKVDEIPIEEPEVATYNTVKQAYKGKQQNIDPDFTPLPLESKTSISIATYYGLPSEFPMKNLFTRSTSKDAYKMLYFTSNTASKLLTHKSLKIVNAGIQLFKRNEATW